jgi:hypothetical protein
MFFDAPYELPPGKRYDVTFERYWTKAQKHLVKSDEDWARLLTPFSAERYRDLVLEEFGECLGLPRYLHCIDNTTVEKKRGAHGGTRRIPVRILAAGEHDRPTDRVRIITAYRCSGFDNRERLRLLKEKVSRMRMQTHENHHLTKVSDINWR